MSKKKLTLEELAVTSFTTESHKVQGGSNSGHPLCPPETIVPQLCTWAICP